MNNIFYDKYIKYKSKYNKLKQFFVYDEYNTYEKRKNKYNELINNKINFSNKIYIIGFGAIGNALLWLILKLFNIKPENITIIEKNSKANINTDRFPKVKFLFDTNFTKNNYKILLKDVQKNDIIIDCGYNIETSDILLFCNEKGASHINSCIQKWLEEDEDNDINNKNKHSLYAYHKQLENINTSIQNKNFNLIVSIGCNPGNVSLWVRKGIIEIAKKVLKKNINDNTPELNKLAQNLKIQTIHISEKDTQRSSIPKNINEYCNTWSKTKMSYYGEILSYVELSWGTHEDEINKVFADFEISQYEDNFAILNKMGLYTYAQSWLPFHNKFIGNIICHDETYTIGNILTVKENNKIIYKPSVYYVYKSSDEATNSLFELKERNEIYQDNHRLLTDDIISGRDLLGLTYFLENGKVYWIGSTLDIKETRELLDNEINDIINSTILQVIVGYITGIIYINDLNNRNEKKGLIVPDEIPLEYMKYQLPFLGNFIFVDKDFYMLSILHNHIDINIFFTKEWKFNNFIIL